MNQPTDISEKGVPEWSDYVPRMSDASPEQRGFYEHWSKKFENGVFIDVDGNTGYLFAHLRLAIEQFVSDKNLNRLFCLFKKMDEGYGHYEMIRTNIGVWTRDAYLYLGMYDEVWPLLKSRNPNIALFINVRSNCKDTSINGQDLLNILGSGSGLTAFGKAKQQQVTALADIYLETFHKTNQKNFIEFFCDKFDFSNITEDDLSKLRELYPNEKKFAFWHKIHRKSKSRPSYQHDLFSNIYYGSFPKPHVTYQNIPGIIEVALLNEIKRILRECENLLREESNLPRVGEGWVSEAQLFYYLREAFPDETIVHHGRPSWLYPQHLDIFFPLKNIAVEYQGAQHQRPVEYFGGEEAFQKQQERDNRKKQLCEKHRCKLLYVYEGYNLDDVKHAIETILLRRK
jgi:hypothetical protein